MLPIGITHDAGIQGQRQKVLTNKQMEITAIQTCRKNDKAKARWVLPSRGPINWSFSRVGGTDNSKKKKDQNLKISR